MKSDEQELRQKTCRKNINCLVWSYILHNNFRTPENKTPSKQLAPQKRTDTLLCMTSEVCQRFARIVCQLSGESDVNPITPLVSLMFFTLSNSRRFYFSMGKLAGR